MTPERLRDIADGLEISADCKAVCDVVTDAELDVATIQREICLALREYADALEKCEPVYQYCLLSWHDTTKEDYEKNCSGGKRILYTAPQVAAVKVPEKFDALYDQSRTPTYMLAWNDAIDEVLRMNEVK